MIYVRTSCNRSNLCLSNADSTRETIVRVYLNSSVLTFLQMPLKKVRNYIYFLYLLLIYQRRLDS